MDQLKISKKMLWILVAACVLLLGLFVGVIFQIVKIKELQRQNAELQRRIEELYQPVGGYREYIDLERFDLVE